MPSSKEFWQQHSIKQQQAPAIQERSEAEAARSRAANAAHGARLGSKSAGMAGVRLIGQIQTGTPGERFRAEQVARIKNKLAKGEATLEQLRTAESGLERQRTLRKKRPET